MKKIILFIVLICSISCTNEYDWATISIPAKQSFLLGELETASFKANVKNLSNKEVKFTVVNTKTQEKKSGFGISEKGEVEVFINSGETAIFTNNNNQEIKLKVLLNRDVEGMRYVESQ